MGGALKAVTKLAGPIMQVAGMFTPMGAIMQGITKAMQLFKTVTGALKQIAPKAMEKLDQKLEKAQGFMQNAVGKAGNFLQALGQGLQGLGNPPAQANPVNVNV